MKKRISVGILVLLILLTSVIGCGAASTSVDDTVAQEAPMDMNVAMEKERAMAYDESEEFAVEEDADMADSLESPVAGGGGESGGEPSTVAMERKLVYTTHLNFETTDYENDTGKIIPLVQKHGGYIESSSIEGSSITETYNNRYAYFTIRMPSQASGTFQSEMEELFHLTNTSQNVEDITQSYYSTESQLKFLNERLDTLNEYLEQAEDLETLLQIEREVSDTRQQIEYTHQYMEFLKTQVNYDTFQVSFREVLRHSTDVKGNTFGERISTALAGSWANFVAGIQNILIYLVGILPVLLIILVAAFLLIRRVRKTRTPRKEHQQRMKQLKEEELSAPEQSETSTDDSSQE